MTIDLTDLEWLAELARLMRSIVREEVSQAIANANRSRQGSPIGIGTRDQGDLEWQEKERSEYMDPTTEAADRSDGESSSPHPMAAKLLNRSRQKQKQNVVPMTHARKPKAAR